MKRSRLCLDGIRAILFDLDGTLYHSRPSFNDVFFGFLERLGVPSPAAQRRRVLRWAHHYFAHSAEIIEDNQKLGHDNDLFLANYLRRWLIAFGCEPDRAAEVAPPFYRQMKETIQPEDWVHPDVPATLKLLKAAGFTLGVVSNRPEGFDDVLDTLGLAPFFAFAVAAGEVDSWKPDEAIFQHAVRRAESCPDCTVYVGDNYFTDIVGAQRAGLQPVLLDPDGVFPEAECPVIQSIADLQQSLG